MVHDFTKQVQGENIVSVAELRYACFVLVSLDWI